MAGAGAYGRKIARFPEQLYFMNFGPYMITQTFLWQMAAAVLATLILACWLFEDRIVQMWNRLRHKRSAAGHAEPG